MDGLHATIPGKLVEEAVEQAEILLAALRGDSRNDGEFLVTHAQHLLACCLEIADARKSLN